MAKNLNSIFAPLQVAPAMQPASFRHRWFRNRVHALFDQLSNGQIIISDPLGTKEFGEAGSDQRCHIRIADISTYSKIAFGGSNGSAEAYLQGLWSCDNPTSLMRVFLRNRASLTQMESGLAHFLQLLLKVWHLLNRNSRTGSRRNIAAHYDIGNEFFRLFLDQHMMYSSALYYGDEDLNAASERKLKRICETLQLNEQDSVLEIGSGWGGFACYAAANYGCKVTTITISQEQFDDAVSRVAAQGLQHLVTVQLQDYRDVSGEYDKLVSIEMIEAVGHHYLDRYFNVIGHSLKSGGKALLQAIVIDDAHYKRALKEVDYIKRYIFPGSFIPCYSVIAQAAGKNGLMLEQLYDMGHSYAQTLRDWRSAFYQNTDKVRQQGYDMRFQRMWEYYLCYCEAGFDERAISVGQILFRKQND